MYAAAARTLSESLTVPTPRTHAPPRVLPLLEASPSNYAPNHAPSYAPSLPEARAAYRDARDWHSQALMIGFLTGMAGALVLSRRRR